MIAPKVLAFSAIALLTITAGEIVASTWPRITHYVIYFPPIAINLVTAGLFFRTLLPGHVPLVTHFSYLVHTSSPLQPPFLRYTRYQTILWTFLCSGCAIGSIYLAARDDIAGWSTFSNIIAPSILISVFIISHFFSALCYKVNESPGKTLRILCTHPGIWLNTKIGEVPYDYRVI
ncbi:MAG: hypothetical protein K0R63_908 [Rickettsiales bacterium]|jgi:uncharacterized membrane protein|nr:hypothetical protein [Rickettsiales bacterium]